MKTKIIPFDLETAKKIQAGEIKGKIKTKCGNEVRILCFDLIDPRDVSFPIVGALYNDKYVRVVRFAECGRYSGAINSELDLVLEVPDNEPQDPQFKPFDKVLVRDHTEDSWQCDLFSHKISNGLYACVAHCWNYRIPYKGNQELVGTTDKPNEEYV